MNILLINHYAGSSKLGMEYRPYYLAKEWIKRGHNVTVIAASNSHVRSIQPVVKNKITKENIEGIDYYWIKTPEYQGNTAKRFINMLTFTRILLQKVKFFSELIQPDVVIASSTYPLDNIPAKKIAKRTKAKLIYEIHDLWPLSPKELGGYSKYHPFIMIMQYAENFAYKNCDFVVSMLPKTFEHTVNHGLNPEKWHYVPNGIFLSEWENHRKISSEIENFIKEKKQNAELNIAYVGTIGIANALDFYIDAAKIMHDKKINFFIVGKGLEKERLIKRKDIENIDNLHFIDSVEKKTIPDLLNYFDILYIGWKKSPLYRFGISPNKIFDYMMSEKPIIHSVEAGNDLVAEAECGISVKPESPSEIVAAINFLKSKTSSELIDMGKRGKEFVLKNHEYSVLADNFIDILSK